MSANLFDLTGKTALVTGGGTGIGQAIAHALSDAGAYLIVIGRREDKLKETLEGRNGLPISVDLMGDGPLTTIKESCQSHGTFPDIIVNAAGLNPRKHADEVSPEVWDKTIHINLSVPFFLAQTFVPYMKKKNWGRIINIASLQSQRAFTNGIAYGASKGGVTQMTRAMAEAWSKDGITANAIAPGFFPTELTAAVFDDSELANHHASMTCIGRNGELSDLIGPAVFLASDASKYVTGQMLAVDGGYTAK
ncbi:MAG: SDR family oxidoreductase [Rhizobiaceae bacterium]|nr:SDR family oxidoreductase [Rhizobiaceae bacterium]